MFAVRASKQKRLGRLNVVSGAIAKRAPRVGDQRWDVSLIEVSQVQHASPLRQLDYYIAVLLKQKLDHILVRLRFRMTLVQFTSVDVALLKSECASPLSHG